MIRSFIVLLLLAVFFLSGMLYGIDQGNQAAPSPIAEENHVENKTEEYGFSARENDTGAVNREILEATEQDNFTQQTATFLEAGVKGIYNVIVHILYQIAQLFF